MTRLCSIVVPVHDRAGLTRQCLEAIFADPPEAPFEVVVVDDASTDSTPEVLAAFGKRVRVVRRTENGGFARACNDGAREARGDLLLFLNNDTVPLPGWLDAMLAYRERNPGAAVVGSKLLFPDDTIQHAGVVICSDGRPRHLYAGFPARHPAVDRSRRFQAVTAACMLLPRAVFEDAGGFDTAFRNSLEDADLCLRLGERGHEVHYCHESVLYHLESVSRERRSKDDQANARLFAERWEGRARPDDLDHYLADGLLRIRYRDSYPIGLEVSPLLAVVAGPERTEEVERLLDERSRQVADLLRETVRLTALVAEADLEGSPPAGKEGVKEGAEEGAKEGAPTAPAAGPAAREEVLARARELELEIGDLQERLAAAVGSNGSAPEGDQGSRRGGGRLFSPSAYLRYRRQLGQVRHLAEERVPEGAVVAVLSRGDDQLLQLHGLTGWHFPQDETGTWLGHHPADSDEAIARLDSLRERGAAYLLVPAGDAWWLDHYDGFGRYLRERCEKLADENGCSLFALGEPRRENIVASA
jgi:GT2 family glycosyltransferase